MTITCCRRIPCEHAAWKPHHRRSCRSHPDLPVTSIRVLSLPMPLVVVPHPHHLTNPIAGTPLVSPSLTWPNSHSAWEPGLDDSWLKKRLSFFWTLTHYFSELKPTSYLIPLGLVFSGTIYYLSVFMSPNHRREFYMHKTFVFLETHWNFSVSMHLLLLCSSLKIHPPHCYLSQCDIL